MYISIYLQKNDPVGRYLLSIPSHYRSASFCMKLEQFLWGMPLEWPATSTLPKEPKELRIYIPIRPDLFPRLTQYINFLLERGVRYPGTHLRDLAYGLKSVGWEEASTQTGPILNYLSKPKRAGRPRKRASETSNTNNFQQVQSHYNDTAAPLVIDTNGFQDAREILKNSQFIVGDGKR